jgi:hypothetical protein
MCYKTGQIINSQHHTAGRLTSAFKKHTMLLKNGAESPGSKTGMPHDRSRNGKNTLR